MKYIKSFNEAKGVWDRENHKYIKTTEYRGIEIEEINGIRYQTWVDGEFYMSNRKSRVEDWIDTKLGPEKD